MKRVQKKTLEKFTFESFNKIYEKDFRENWNRKALTNIKAETLCYSDVARQIAKLHILYKEAGIQKGDKIALFSPNQANWAVSIISITTYGAVAVPLLHEFKPANVHHLVSHCEAKLLLTEQNLWQGLSTDEMPSLIGVIRMEDFSELFSRSEALSSAIANSEANFTAMYPDGFGPENINYYEDSAEEMAMINYTSGTSGFSKGVMIPYRSLVSNCLFGRQAVPCIDNTSKVVSILPSAHMYGMMFEVLYELSCGAHINFLTKTPSPAVLIETMKEIKPDLLVAVPLIFEKVYRSKVKPTLEKPAIKILTKIPGLNQIVYSKVRKELIESFGGKFYEVILGGAAFNKEVEEFMHKIKFPFTVGYGMTECAPIISYEAWDSARLYSCGRPARYLEIKIDSKDPQNVPGEILVKGPNVFLGYYNNEDATKAVFTEDGWFRTGDMGVMDEDQFIYIKGRCKCMLLGPSGQNIYPEEIEDSINNLKFVSDSLVIEDSSNNKLVALIYPDYVKAKQNGLDSEALKARLENDIKAVNKERPSYERITKIEILENDFERTPKKSIKRYLYQK